MNEKPDFLYHYTTVSSLAMILQSRSIRFSPLTMLDDKQEEQSREMHNYGKYTFVSCWTASSYESIPMWHIYAGLEAGTRIKLHSIPFKPESIPSSESILYGRKDVADSFDYYFMFYNNSSEILQKVVYTYNEKSLNPKLIEPLRDSSIGMTYKLGIFKNRYWDFQDEWRYILHFNPSNIKDISHDAIADALRADDLPFKDYFLPISDQYFDQIEITTSPKISQANRIILEELKNTYCKNMIIHKSVLEDKIR